MQNAHQESEAAVDICRNNICYRTTQAPDEREVGLHCILFYRILDASTLNLNKVQESSTSTVKHPMKFKHKSKFSSSALFTRYSPSRMYSQNMFRCGSGFLGSLWNLGVGL